MESPDWELEIRKRYSQPLATEVGEFPDAESIHSRMVPICYEESVVNGPAPNCATYVAIATENYVKDFLSIVFSRTRSNGPSGTINGTMTRNYRLQLEQEELAFTRGDLARNAASGLLPVEAAEASTRQGLSAQDLKFATEMGGGILGHQPLVMNQIMNGYTKDELEAESEGYTQSLEGVRSLQAKQTLPITAADGTTEDYEDQMDWEGADTGDQQQLGNLLDECLSMAV
ncbi:hypothetical protein KEM55_008577 [Ascosphaera atra]|nr:hypothetical protein KEM55_008577 [Ascosphaera atra]